MGESRQTRATTITGRKSDASFQNSIELAEIFLEMGS